MRDRISLGRRGEQLAVELLQGSGMSVVDRNWRCQGGEIDIVALDASDGCTVFCEVKCRTGTGFGDPLEAITHAKLRRLRLLAGRWLTAHASAPTRIRLDAVGVLFAQGQPTVRHIRGIG